MLRGNKRNAVYADEIVNTVQSKRVHVVEIKGFSCNVLSC